MDFTRVTSPPSIRVHDHNGNHSRRPSSSRPTGGSFSRTPGPMAISSTRHDDPPPPLPPPRIIHDLSAGRDPGWEWGNKLSGSFGKRAGASMAGSNLPKSWTKKAEHNGQDERPQRPEYKRRESTTSTLISPTDTDRGYDFGQCQDEGYYSLSTSRPSVMSQQLHGEKQLQQRNLEYSSQAYDNKLLSKIGRPRTPPRTSILGCLQNSPTSSFPFYPHSNQPRSLSFPNSKDPYSNSAYSDSPPIKREPSGYDDNPRARPISPGLFSSAASAKNFMDWRTPKPERDTPSSFDPDEYPPYPQRFPSSSNVLRQQKSRRSTSGSLLSSYDEEFAGSSLKNTANHFKRENYDQPIFSEQDSTDPTFHMQEPLRQLHLEDRTPQNNYPDSSTYYHSTSNPSLRKMGSRLGMKRKPSRSPPPPPDRSHDANAQLLAAAAMHPDFQSNPSQRVSPGGRFGQSQGSISSQSSFGARNNSYASSAGLSVGGSSMTSFDQHSPGGISPSSDQQHYQHNGQDSPYVNSLPMNQSTRNTRSQQQYPQAPLENQDIDQKPMITPNPHRHTIPNMQSQALICQCCPKKPKKFDTPEQLRHHESEKQYQCNFCSNRFKNKNEAERHQNSLHLRKHSWSCATLNGQYDNAFYPSTTIPPAENSPAQPPTPTNTLAAFDTCGYCGEQFTNEPAPDWDERSRHLINTHKFGECNQSKKFFRADHFRQHLKHSHAGTSGKWTNMLETACMKDEPNPEPQDSSNNNNMSPQGAPVANMGMGQPNMGQANMGQSPMGQANMGQAHMGQANMGQNTGQVNMNQANQGMGQAQMAQMAQMDMSNIDPSIGLQTMGNMAPMGNLGNMAPPGRGMGMQGVHDRTDEMPSDM